MRVQAQEELGLDPLLVGELASVGFLASAASRLGYVALTEVVEHRNDSNPRGRQDLLLAGHDLKRPIGFEFKVGWPTNKRAFYLETLLSSACEDASVRLPGHFRRFGGVIFVPWMAHASTPEPEYCDQAIANCRAITPQADLSVVIEGCDRPALLVLQHAGSAND